MNKPTLECKTRLQRLKKSNSKEINQILSQIDNQGIISTCLLLLNLDRVQNQDIMKIFDVLNYFVSNKSISIKDGVEILNYRFLRGDKDFELTIMAYIKLLRTVDTEFRRKHKNKYKYDFFDKMYAAISKNIVKNFIAREIYFVIKEIMTEDLSFMRYFIMRKYYVEFTFFDEFIEDFCKYFSEIEVLEVFLYSKDDYHRSILYNLVSFNPYFYYDTEFKMSRRNIVVNYMLYDYDVFYSDKTSKAVKGHLRSFLCLLHEFITKNAEKVSLERPGHQTHYQAVESQPQTQHQTDEGQIVSQCCHKVDSYCQEVEHKHYHQFELSCQEVLHNSYQQVDYSCRQKASHDQQKSCEHQEPCPCKSHQQQESSLHVFSDEKCDDSLDYSQEDQTLLHHQESVSQEPRSSQKPQTATKQSPNTNHTKLDKTSLNLCKIPFKSEMYNGCKKCPFYDFHERQMNPALKSELKAMIEDFNNRKELDQMSKYFTNPFLLLRFSEDTNRFTLGNFLGKEKHTEYLRMFLDTFYFGKKGVLEALREFLSAFVLPGEMQIIVRILKEFGIKLYNDRLTESTKAYDCKGNENDDCKGDVNNECKGDENKECNIEVKGCENFDCGDENNECKGDVNTRKPTNISSATIPTLQATCLDKPKTLDNPQSTYNPTTQPLHAQTLLPTTSNTTLSSNLSATNNTTPLSNTDETYNILQHSANDICLLLYALVMLNTTIHNPNVKQKKNKKMFLLEMKRIKFTANFEEAYFSFLYYEIKRNPIKFSKERKLSVDDFLIYKRLKAELQKVELQKTDLQKTDLQKTDLQKADLQKADLQNKCKLSGLYFFDNKAKQTLTEIKKSICFSCSFYAYKNILNDNFSSFLNEIRENAGKENISRENISKENISKLFEVLKYFKFYKKMLELFFVLYEILQSFLHENTHDKNVHEKSIHEKSIHEIFFDYYFEILKCYDELEACQRTDIGNNTHENHSCDTLENDCVELRSIYDLHKVVFKELSKNHKFAGFKRIANRFVRNSASINEKYFERIIFDTLNFKNEIKNEIILKNCYRIKIILKNEIIKNLIENKNFVNALIIKIIEMNLKNELEKLFEILKNENYEFNEVLLKIIIEMPEIVKDKILNIFIDYLKEKESKNTFIIILHINKKNDLYDLLCSSLVNEYKKRVRQCNDRETGSSTVRLADAIYEDLKEEYFSDSLKDPQKLITFYRSSSNLLNYKNLANFVCKVNDTKKECPVKNVTLLNNINNQILYILIKDSILNNKDIQEYSLMVLQVLSHSFFTFLVFILENENYIKYLKISTKKLIDKILVNGMKKCVQNVCVCNKNHPMEDKIEQVLKIMSNDENKEDLKEADLCVEDTKKEGINDVINATKFNEDKTDDLEKLETNKLNDANNTSNKSNGWEDKKAHGRKSDGENNIFEL